MANPKVPQSLDNSGKYSDLLKITDDPEVYVITWVNIGYFFLQDIMKGLNLKEFFRLMTGDRKITFDCFTISRFLTYARILDPHSSNSVVTRDPSVLYYDCTNYYFECEQPDEDVIDEVTGKLSMAAPPKILL